MRMDTSGRVRSQSHLAWIRGHECAAHPHGCDGPVQSHHVLKGNLTRGKKPGDDKAIPLCVEHHGQAHNGPQSFEARYGIDMLVSALELWAFSPHGVKWRQEHRL